MDLRNDIKYANICIIGIPEGEEKKEGTETLFKEINS